MGLHLPKRTSGNLECRLIDARRFAGRCSMQLRRWFAVAADRSRPPGAGTTSSGAWNVSAVGISERSNEASANAAAAYVGNPLSAYVMVRVIQ